MIKLLCDKCGADCGLNAFDIRVNVIHNPIPVSYKNFGEPHLTDDTTHYRFMLCQECERKTGFPNPYEVEVGKPLRFRDTEEETE